MKRPSTDPSSPTARRGDTLLLRHTLSGVLRMGSQLVSMMILVPLIISYLGESRFGVWALGLALVGGLSLLEMGLLQSANRFMSTIDAAQDPILFRETVCTAFWLTLPLCGILLAALPLGDLFIDWIAIPEELSTEAVSMVSILITHAALSIPLRLFPGLLISQRLMSRVHIVQGITSLLAFLLSWLALRTGAGLRGLALVHLGCMLLEHSIYIILATGVLPLSSFHPTYFSRTQLPRLSEFALFAWIGQVSNVIFLRISVFLVQGVSGVVATGAYSVASRLANISLDLSNQAIAAGGPKVTALANQPSRRQEAGWLTMSLIRRSLLFCGPLAAVALPLGYPFLYGWVGPQIATLAELPLALLVLDVVFSMPVMAATHALAVGGHHRFTNLFSILMGAVFLPAAWLLGRATAGPTGPAMASLLVTLCIALPVISSRFSHHFEVRLSASWQLIIWPHLIPFTVATLTGTIFRILILRHVPPGRTWLFASAGAAALAAGSYILLYTLRFAPEEERRALRRLIIRDTQAPAITIVPLADTASWASVQAAVQTCEASCDCGLYSSWTYAHAAWECSGSPRAVWLITVGDPEDPAGLFFFSDRVRTHLKQNVTYLQSIDHHVMRRQPSLAPSGGQLAAIEALITARTTVHQVTGASILSLTKLLHTDAQEIQTLLHGCHIPCLIEEMGISYEIVCSEDVGAYWSTKKAKSLYNLRRAGRLLQERIGPLRVDRIRGSSWDDPELQARWVSFVDLRRRSWQLLQAVERDPAEPETMLAFDEEVIRDWADRGWLEISLLRSEDTIVAGILSCCTDQTCWVVIQAFDEAYAAYSPGRVLFAQLIDQCHADGIRRWVLGPTSDSGKRFWANRQELLVKITFPLGGWTGRLWLFASVFVREGSLMG